MTDYRLNKTNFYNWLSKADAERLEGSTYVIITDYESAIEVDTDFRHESISFWKVTKSPFKLDEEQVEALFEMLGEAISPSEDLEPYNENYNYPTNHL